MRIAVDVMGGDWAPAAPVRACLTFSRARPDVRLTLVGDEPRIRGLMGEAVGDRIDVIHTTSVIGSGEDPVRSVRRKPDSSLVVSARLVKDGRVDAMISAGNTGALVAAGLLVIGRLEGVDRPALAPVLPTFRGPGALLVDAGATMDASPHNLVEFARMGAAYSRYVLGVREPRVALLNVGSEASKGNHAVREAYHLLRESLPEFIGNVEAREILDGGCDVIVCDGFVGNVVLKLVEGVGLGVFAELREALTANWRTKLAAQVLKPRLRSFRQRFDYAEYGGAPFLGVAGGCIKAHGSSGERAWYRAIEQAVRFVEQGLLAKLSEAR
ncbi:MAG: phosphate acyltransferase PlsX [Alicyclobacillaceae bacterium]|nr:phosphate acyltransferase PlsX [Alicyclobacillaceae bacterium]